MTPEAVTRAFESEQGQERLYSWALEIFTSSRLSVDVEDRKRFDEVYGSFLSQRKAKRTPEKKRAAERYKDYLSRNVVQKAIPSCWGTDEDPRGMRNVHAVASVLLSASSPGKLEADEVEILEALCSADIAVPEYDPVGECEGAADFDPLDPGTWSAGIATAILRPSGDVSAWCWTWQQIYFSILGHINLIDTENDLE